MEKICNICKDKFETKKETKEYCSLKCLNMYINSKEFDNELNEILDEIKKD